MTKLFLVLLTLLLSLSGPAMGEYSDFRHFGFAPKSIVPHKNSLDYVGYTHVYRVRGPNGTHKVGESAQGVRVGDGASVRRKNFLDKALARDFETRLIERFRRMYGQDTLPGNKTNR